MIKKELAESQRKLADMFSQLSKKVIHRKIDKVWQRTPI